MQERCKLSAVQVGKQRILSPQDGEDRQGANDQSAGGSGRESAGLGRPEDYQDKEVRAIAKRRSKHADLLKKGYAMVYNQCLQEVKDKLEATEDWERIQREQLLDEPIIKIKRICIGFNDHKQEIFNLVQALKTLSLYTQKGRETVEE